MPEARELTPNETVLWFKTIEIANTFKGSVGRSIQEPGTKTAIAQITAEFKGYGDIATPQIMTAVYLTAQFLDLPQNGAGPISKTALENIVLGAQFLLGPITDQYQTIQSEIESNHEETIAAMNKAVKQKMEEALKDPRNYEARIAIKFIILGAQTAAELYGELFPQIAAILTPQPEPQTSGI